MLSKVREKLVLLVPQGLLQATIVVKRMICSRYPEQQDHERGNEILIRWWCNKTLIITIISIMMNVVNVVVLWVFLLVVVIAI